MVFSSIIFLFFFLPTVLLFYLCAGRRGRNTVLLVASLVFYAWGEQQYVLVMLVSIVLNYVLGLLLAWRQREGRTGKAVLFVGVAANLALLVVFKYTDFLVANTNLLLQGAGLGPIHPPAMHLPIGISFFTFQALSYVIDLYRGVNQVQKNPLHLGLYISLFPQLIAGPIVRYREVADQIANRRVTMLDFAAGAERFIFGLGKKILIANPMAAMADTIFALPAGQLSSSTAWLGVVCYGLQIYYDFSGYSDMAIGLGRMFGFTFPENFNYPYISRSIREFWRRWHITLSTWFRDYLYIPLGGNRFGPVRTAFHLVLVFLLCGLWHGASWNFVVWGLLHGIFLVLERGWLGRIMERLPGLVQNGYAMMVVLHGWVFFRLTGMDAAIGYVAAMYGGGDASAMPSEVILQLNALFFCTLLMGCLLCFPLHPFLNRVLGAWQDKSPRTGRLWPVQLAKGCLSAAILVLSTLFLAVGSYNPFIYFRF